MSQSLSTLYVLQNLCNETNFKFFLTCKTVPPNPRAINPTPTPAAPNTRTGRENDRIMILCSFN